MSIQDELVHEISRLPQPPEDMGDGPCERVTYALRLIKAAPALLEALQALVKVNEEWNASVREIIGKPNRPLFADDYLKQARLAIQSAEEG